MAYIHISSTRDIGRSVSYAFDEKEENDKNNPRVLMSAGINISDEKGIAEMKDVLKRYDKDDGEFVQGYHIIQSFGKDELSKDNEKDVIKANKIGYELAVEQFGEDRQAVIVTQADGRSGMLHNHIVVNSVDFIKGKSLRGNAKNWSHLTVESDKVLENNDLVPLEPVNNKTAWDKVSQTEIERRAKGLPVWKDDLKELINESMMNENNLNEQDFKEDMDTKGVTVEYINFYDEVKERDVVGMQYDYKTDNGQTKKSRSKMLGAKFMRENLNKNLELNNVKVENKQMSEQTNVEEIEDFASSIDFGAEIEKRRPKERDVSERVEQSEGSKRIEERIKQSTEAEEQAKANAVAEQLRQEELKRQEKEQFDEEQVRKELQKIEDDKKEVENKRIVAQQQADLEAKQKAEQEDKDIRDDYEKRIQRASISKDPVSDRKIEMFKVAEEKIKHKGVFNGKEYTFNYSDNDINHSANISMADEDRERRQAPALEQQEDEHELE